MGLYNTQLELHESLICRAASELVICAVSNTLDAIIHGSCLHSAIAPAYSSISDPAERLFLDPAERLLTTDEVLDDGPAWPIEQVVAELSQAAQEQSTELKWQHLTGEKIFPPDQVECALTEDCAMTEAPTLESNDSVNAAGFLRQHRSADTSQAPLVFLNMRINQQGALPVPIFPEGPMLKGPVLCANSSSSTEGAQSSVPAAECDRCSVGYTCETHCGSYQCNDGVPGCMCSQSEPELVDCAPGSSSSTGGARSISDAFQSGPETEDYLHVPIGMTGELVRAEQHPLAGFSCGGGT